MRTNAQRQKDYRDRQRRLAHKATLVALVKQLKYQLRESERLLEKLKEKNSAT